MDNSPLLVACLCAEWCGSCRDYEATFQRLSTEFGAACNFIWIDIEDDADKIGAVDVDNFPTLLIARAGAPLFFGAVTPHAQTLQRLVTSALAGDLEPVTGAEADIVALARQLTSSPDA